MKRRKFLTTCAAALAMSASLIVVDAADAAPEAGQRAGWTSQFNGSKAGWQNVVGNWTLRPGNLYSTGIPGKRTSVKHINNYTNFYYTVRMKRRGNSTGLAANAVVLRGNPSSRTVEGYWRPSYLFQYANQGYFSVFRFNPDGSFVAVKSWTTTGVVNRTGYNTVEVWVDGNFLDFHINGVHLWSGFDAGGPTFGNVGVSIFTEPGKFSETFLDSATLVIDSSRRHEHASESPGKAVAGGSVDMAPR
ncbi:MAG: hypothetical protein WBP28_13020 [Nostocoides sp.]